MKRKYFILLVLLISIFFISSISALVFQYPTNEININSIEQMCIIKDKSDLYCNVLLDISFNKTTPNTYLEIGDRNLGDPIFYPESTKICEWGDINSFGDYLNFNLSCNSTGFFKSKINDYEDLRIDLDTYNLKRGRYSIFFNYTNKNFIIKDPLYNSIFFSLGNVDDNNTRVWRTIILPKNSVIDSGSLYNFEILAILDDGRRIISSEYNRANMVYRDWDKEQKENTKKDISIIFISLSFSVLFSLILLRKKQTKRTRNLWLLGCSSLLIVSFILFYNLIGTFWSILLAILFVLIILFMGLAKASDELDMGNASIKRDLYEIFKIIKANKFKTLCLFILPILLLIFFIQNNFNRVFAIFILLVLALFMKTNKPSR